MNAREVIWFDTFILACLEDFETSTAHSALRDPATLQPYLPDSQPDLLLDRGFTCHEHLTAFGLINMNARLYDPAAGRFLNPDPIIQAPDNTQNLNRYTYCLNNPLRFVGPVISTSIAIADALYGDEFYNYMQQEYGN